MQKRENPAGVRGRWNRNDDNFITPFPCRLQVENGTRCDACEYRRVVVRPRSVKILCRFLGETLEVRHG